MSTQSLKKQLEALQKLQHFLEGFQEELIDTMERYKKRVEELHIDGLSNEVYQKYSSDNYSRDKDYIHSLIKHIEDTDIPYIKRNLGATDVNITTASGATFSGGLDF
ncbi:MAG: hypothetical protein F082_87 [bacterium F082]|nr:MAG: hypothetical protein F082_87 [bacterium F082]KWW31836.1 MAG: hypothetical protein AUK64_85 [bacterium P201]